MIADDLQACSISFLDCRSYYDLAAEIVITVIACLVLMKALGNYRDLKLEQSLATGLQYADNLGRKVRINLFNIVFLISFILHIVFSMILFTVSDEEEGTNTIINNKLNLWYQFTHVTSVQLLNYLEVVIGWLYWKTLNSFYELKGLRTPKLYHNNAKYLIFFILFFIGGIILACIVDSIFDFEGMQRLINWLMLGSQFISTLFFILFRVLYYRNIFCSVKLSKRSVQRQYIYNILIILTSLGRICLCILEAMSINFQSLRNYESKPYCHDVLPFHALLLLIIGLIIDLLPSFIFTRMFSNSERNRTTSNIEQTLFSGLQSEASGM